MTDPNQQQAEIEFKQPTQDEQLPDYSDQQQAPAKVQNPEVLNDAHDHDKNQNIVRGTDNEQSKDVQRNFSRSPHSRNKSPRSHSKDRSPRDRFHEPRVNEREAKESVQVYVGGIAREVNDRDLKDLFKQFGHIQEVTMKGRYAFVEFENACTH